MTTHKQSFSMNDFDNVYENINECTKDPIIESTGIFVMLKHQILPKYFMTTSELDAIILHYSLGSGKTATMVNIFANILTTTQIDKLLVANHITDKPLGVRDLRSDGIIAVIVGAWQTQAQTRKELHRHLFRPHGERYGIDTIIDIPYSIGTPEYEAEMDKRIDDIIDRHVLMLGYQSLFNNIFKSSNENLTANIGDLLIAYNNNGIKLNEVFMESLRGSYIIIDEMQRLYSFLGLNTYGFAAMVLRKNAAKYGYKMIFMSGTMINTTIVEVFDVINLLSSEPKYMYPVGIYNESVLGLSNVMNITDDEITKVIKTVSQYMLHYDQSLGTNTIDREPIITEITNEYNEVPLPEYLKGEHLQALKYPQMPLLPLEIHIGNIVLDDTTVKVQKSTKYNVGKQSMMLYSLLTQGFQSKEYSIYVSNRRQSMEIIDEDISESSVHIHDAYIPESGFDAKAGIYGNNTDQYYGKFLQMDALKDYSATGYELCRLCIANALLQEKTVVYHSKLNAFGIKQYQIILTANGMVAYGEHPTDNSICRHCGSRKCVHDETKCEVFDPIYVATLTGDSNQSDRDKLVNNIYNNPNNLYGASIMVIFVSDVAYSGVSFFNTNNIVIVSRVPNMSKWKQIYARIIRTRSHTALPPNKRYAKVYTFVIALPDELKIFPSDANLTLGQTYYASKLVLDNRIYGFINSCAKMCPSYMLTNQPEKFKYSNKTIEDQTKELYNEDVISSIYIACDVLASTIGGSIWTVSEFIKRLRDTSLSLSVFSLNYHSDDDILHVLVSSNKIKLLRDPSDAIVVIINDSPVLTQTHVPIERHSVSFDTLRNSINIDNTIEDMIAMLPTISSTPLRLASVIRIMKSVGDNYKILVDKLEFWDVMYDVGNDYYETDATDYFNNHIRENRDRNNMSGCYYGDRIIFMNGTSTLITPVPVETQTLEGIPAVFRLMSITNSESSPFFIHVSIIRRATEESIIVDRRRIIKGITCVSMNSKTLTSWFPQLSKLIHKKAFCSELVYELCEMQSKSKIKFVLSPFER